MMATLTIRGPHTDWTIAAHIARENTDHLMGLKLNEFADFGSEAPNTPYISIRRTKSGLTAWIATPKGDDDE